MAGSNLQRPPMRKSRRKSRRNLNKILSPLPSVIRYTGPIVTVPTDDTTVTLFDSFDISTTNASPLQLKFNNNPSSARNWTEYSTAWDQYRVLGIRFRYYPINTANTTAIPGQFGVQSIVHGTTPNVASLAQAMSTGLARPWNFFKSFSREWRMEEVNEATFGLTASPSATSDTLVLYASTASNTIDYGTVMIEYLVQFKVHSL